MKRTHCSCPNHFQQGRVPRCVPPLENPPAAELLLLRKDDVGRLKLQGCCCSGPHDFWQRQPGESPWLVALARGDLEEASRPTNFVRWL